MSAPGWQLVPLKTVVSCNDEVLTERFPSESEITYVEISDVDEYDGIQWNEPIRFGEAASRARRIVRDGDVLVSTVRTYLRAVASVDHAPANAIASTGFAVLRPRSIEAGFLKYAVLNQQFLDDVIARSIGVSYPAINASELIAIKIAIPDRATQQVIAALLDRETAEIDAFIADQEELIALLTERRAATISHAVTKGLDPSAPLKDTGVDWLGEVPAAWAVTKVSTYFTVVLGKMLDSGRVRAGDGVDLPYLRAGNLQEEGLSLDSVNEMPFTPREVKLWSLKKDDLLVVEGGAIGVNVVLSHDMDGWGFQKTINRVRPVAEASTRFLGYCLDALRYSGALDMIANKSTIAHFTAEKLGGLKLAFPHPTAQIAIAEHLDRETAEIAAAIADAREAIALSKERRAALISAAVTGKIDVRNHGGVE